MKLLQIAYANFRQHVIDYAYVGILMLYVLAGTLVVPMHGDEFMQISMAKDVFYILHGNWQQIAFQPPVQPDTEQELRLINGSINKTAIGLTWILAGRDQSTLPDIYAWAMPLDWNRAQGKVPSDDGLHLARWSSALFTALGVIPLFLLGWELQRRSAAYPAALIYALHPAILLNGRRAMMEGSLLLTSLLAIYWLVTLILAQYSPAYNGFMRRLPSLMRYSVLGILIGLTVSAKYTGIAIAATALLCVLLIGLTQRRSWQPFTWVGFSALVALLTWFALNPVYWNDPIHAMQSSLDARVNLLTSQTRNNPQTYNTLWQHLHAVLSEPFLTAPQYYEAPTWQGVIDSEIVAYQNSSVAGWIWGPIIGTFLIVMAIIGLGALIHAALKRSFISWVILIWTAMIIAASLAIPLDWQRYYLPLMLVSIILAALGLAQLIAWVSSRGGVTISVL